MLKIELDKNEHTYLCRAEGLARSYMAIILSGVWKNDKYLLTISELQADEIRDFCSEQLQLIGFDEKYEPNAEGKILESLIDKLFIG